MVYVQNLLVKYHQINVYIQRVMVSSVSV